MHWGHSVHGHTIVAVVIHHACMGRVVCRLHLRLERIAAALLIWARPTLELLLLVSMDWRGHQWIWHASVGWRLGRLVLLQMGRLSWGRGVEGVTGRASWVLQLMHLFLLVMLVLVLVLSPRVVTSGGSRPASIQRHSHHAIIEMRSTARAC